MTVAPPIYGQSSKPARLDLLSRLGAAIVALTALTPLVVGAWLHPSPRGLGTHMQLGLASCNWLRTTGFPCPFCGMTTSFSFFSHGNWLASFYLQPMGFVLAVLTAVTFWIAGYSAFTGRPIFRVLGYFDQRAMLIGLLAFGLAAWGWKILIYTHGLDGWGR